jgi:hypothetical protein
MDIIIHIKPEVETELTRQASAHGVDLDTYAAILLEEAVHMAAASKKLSPDQLDRTLQALDALRGRLPKSASEKESTAAAARRLATFGKRHGLSLGGSIKDLLHESRP